VGKKCFVRWRPTACHRDISFVLLCRSHFRVVFTDVRGGADIGPAVQFLSPDAADQRRQVLDTVSRGGVHMRPKEIPKETRSQHASPAGLEKSPQFAEWMTCALYEDGSARIAPTLTVWCTSGEWRAVLKDKAEKVCLWLSEGTFLKLMKLVNDMCQLAEAPWRVDDQGDARDGKRLPKRS